MGGFSWEGGREEMGWGWGCEVWGKRREKEKKKWGAWPLLALASISRAEKDVLFFFHRGEIL